MFENDKSLNRHIKIEHKDDVKKAYSKEAMEMVMIRAVRTMGVIK